LRINKSLCLLHRLFASVDSKKMPLVL